MSLFSMDDSSVWGKGSSLFNISSPLNDLLEKDDFTLEQVLEEDELIQEVKTRNTKLLEFLAQEQSVLKMIEYIVRSPEDPTDDMRTLKYPYMSCEVICCDIMSITETLASASSGKIVETMFEFLYQSTPLDSRLAGYFEKIMSMLMVRKPQEMTALMNKHSEKLLAGFVAHAASFSIAELLKRLLQPYHSDYMDEMDFPGMSMGFPPSSNAWYGGGHDDDDISVGTPTSSQKSLAWQHEPRAVDLLIANLAPTDATGAAVDSDVHKHSAEVLVDIIHCGTRAQQNDPSSPTSGSSPVSFALLEYLETKDVVERIIALAVPSESFSASSMTSALSVLSALLSRHTNARYSASDELPVAVAGTLARIPQIVTTLRGEDHSAGTLVNQRHQETPRLGLRRLKLVGLLVLLMQSKFNNVDAALLQENVVDVCLDLFFTFESNNMLHADVESMVVGILESGGPDLLTALITNARLLPRIIEAHAKNEAATATAKGNSLGYMGHLHRICNMIMSLAEDVRGSTADGRSLNDMTHADSVLELLEADSAVWAAWDELASKVLAPIYERERLPLGGVSVSSGHEDPYMGFNQSDELLNAQFAEMLGASGFGAAANDFDNYFDLKHSSNDTPMLPEIMNDSSSSEDEDDDGAGARFRRDSDDDGFDFDPRGAAASASVADGGTSKDETAAATSGDATDRWASFEASGTWAQFDDSSAATDFTATFDSTPMDESEIMSESPTASAADVDVIETAAVAAVEVEAAVEVAATETVETAAVVVTETTETTTTVTAVVTETTTVTTESVDVSSVEVSVEAVEGAAAATED